MGYTTVIERKIYIGSNWEHRREKYGKLEIKSFPSNITPFDTSKISEIIIQECRFDTYDENRDRCYELISNRIC